MMTVVPLPSYNDEAELSRDIDFFDRFDHNYLLIFPLKKSIQVVASYLLKMTLTPLYIVLPATLWITDANDLHDPTKGFISQIPYIITISCMAGNTAYTYYYTFVEFVGVEVLPYKPFIPIIWSVITSVILFSLQVYFFGYFPGNLLVFAAIETNLGPNLISYLLLGKENRQVPSIMIDFHRARKFMLFCTLIFYFSTIYAYLFAAADTQGQQIIYGLLYGIMIWVFKEISLLMYASCTRRTGSNLRAHSVFIDLTGNIFVCLALPEIKSYQGFLGILIPHIVAFCITSMSCTLRGTSMIISFLSSIPYIKRFYQHTNQKRMLRRRATSIQLMAFGYILGSCLYCVLAPLMRYGGSHANYPMSYYPYEQYQLSLIYALIWPIPFVIIAIIHRLYIRQYIKIDPLYMVSRYFDQQAYLLYITPPNCMLTVLLVLIKNAQVIWYIFPKDGYSS